MDKKLLKILQEKKENAYRNPDSILKEFDIYLESNGIYRSFNENIFFKSIANKKEHIGFTLNMYSKATLDNEKEFLLYCLYHMGYGKNNLTDMVVNIFQSEKENTYLWHYADFLYLLKDYSRLNDYISIVMDRTYGKNREMLILLIGESKSLSVVPYLLDLLQNEEILGHVLIALSNFTIPEILPIMKKYTNHKIKWIAEVATDYVTTH